MPNERLRNLGLLVVASALALVLAEAVVRATGAAPEASFEQRGRYRLSANPRIGYEPVPHLEYGGSDLVLWEWTGRSNAFGFRDVERQVAKRPGTLRILVLGDSITAGHGIADAAAVFPAVLERLLAERGVAAEVLNFGVSGYNTEQEVATLVEKGLAFQPDVVVLAYCLNDAQGMESNIVDRLRAEAEHHVPAGARLTPLLGSSALYRFARFRVLASDEPTLREDAQGDAFEALHELGRLARSTPFRALVAVFPVFGFEPYPYADQHAAVARAAADAGLEHLDLLAAFQRCTVEAPMAMDTLHPNVDGHRCAAEALADALAPTGDAQRRR